MSEVWKYFTKTDTNTVNCKMCPKSFKFSGSTSSFLHHLKTKHNDEYVGAKGNSRKRSNSNMGAEIETQEVSGNSESNLGTNKNKQLKLSIFKCNSKHEVISAAIAKMISVDMLPISFVEGNGFKELITLLAPGYIIPSKNTIKTRIELLYNNCLGSLKKEVKKFSNVAITTDCWTANNNDSYITVTLHGIDENWELRSFNLTTEILSSRHTAENLQISIEGVLNQWEVMDAVVAVVHDNAANIINAVKLMNCDSVCCFAHSLQLAINKSLEVNEITQALHKCSSTVSHFKHSSKAYNYLKTVQVQLQLPQHKLIQSVKTRWNSTYYMIERLVEQKIAISNVLQDRTLTTRQIAVQLEISESEWSIIESLVTILKPFALATALISSEKEPTISMGLPIISSLVNMLSINRDDDKVIKTFKGGLRNQLQCRFNVVDNFTQSTIGNLPGPLDVATFLDPRHKNYERSCGIRNKVQRKIKNILEVEFTTTGTSSQQSQAQPSADAKSILDILFPSEEILQTNELDIYAQEVPISKASQCLAWWKANENRFPNLSKLAKRYLCIPVTSTPSERSFSTAGCIITNKRNCLKGKTATMLIFLHDNLKKNKTT